jgi:hypothetical protein
VQRYEALPFLSSVLRAATLGGEPKERPLHVSSENLRNSPCMSARFPPAALIVISYCGSNSECQNRCTSSCFKDQISSEPRNEPGATSTSQDVFESGARTQLENCNSDHTVRSRGYVSGDKFRKRSKLRAILLSVMGLMTKIDALLAC